MALEDVSFQVSQGEVVGLIGGSGSGKTTIARIIMGLERSDAGEIRFDGRELTGLSQREQRRVKRHLHLVLQDPYDSLTGGMRVKEIIAEPMVIHCHLPRKQRENAVLEALQEVALCPAIEFSQRRPAELSGGQRQRVALARALVLRPRLIIADEPTSMLDVSIRTDIVKLMRQLKVRYGISYLFITHDLALAESFCDRLVVLHQGRVVESGSTDQVIGSPQHPYTRRLMEAIIAPIP
jgi:ABC-type glutathione transport system ATPase component